MRPLYLDYASTAPLRDEARSAMVDAWERTAGNPSSVHHAGRQSRQLLTQARRDLAQLLGCQRDEVVFTGNGSEANVLAVVGVCRALPEDRRHVLTTPIEHPSLLDALRDLDAQGEIRLTEVRVDESGRVHPDEILRQVQPETGFASIMLVNNELGTIQPVARIAASLADRDIILHTDASQAAGKIAFDAAALGAPLVTVSPHKFGGPCGLGILLVRQGVILQSPFSKNRQERGLRGGTEDVPSIAAAAAALQAASTDLLSEATRLTELANFLRTHLAEKFPEVVFHSPAEQVLPGLVNASLPGIEGAWLVAALDQKNVAVSHGSACSSRSELPSHVLEAVGAGELARSSLRVSMGRGSSRSDVEEFVDRLRFAVDDMRASGFFDGSQNRCNQRTHRASTP